MTPSPGVSSTDDDKDADNVIFPTFLFTDNETNKKKLFNVKNKTEFVKDAFHEHIADEKKDIVNPEKKGTKATAWFSIDSVPAGESVTIRFKYTNKKPKDYENFDEDEFDNIMEAHQDEADDFYQNISPAPISDDERQVQRQAFAGLLWTKQF